MALSIEGGRTTAVVYRDIEKRKLAMAASELEQWVIA